MELKPKHIKHTIWTNILLIVPYGIETRKGSVYMPFLQLLIVPYGIETSYSLRTNVLGLAFNRTLWN